MRRIFASVLLLAFAGLAHAGEPARFGQPSVLLKDRLGTVPARKVQAP